MILDQDRVLLVERANEPLRGYWSLPGGGLEVGETLNHAVRREVLEETGLIVEPVAIIEIFERMLYDAAGVVEYHYVLVDYLCTPVGGALLAGDDAGKVAWISRAELPHLLLTEGTLPVIEKAFARK